MTRKINIRYEISRFQDYYRLYKIIETSTGINMIICFKGTKQECIEEKKRLENENKSNNC